MSRIRRTYLPQPLAQQLYGSTQSYAPSARRVYGVSQPQPAATPAQVQSQSPAQAPALARAA